MTALHALSGELAALAGVRQVEAVVRSDRAADRAALAVRRVWYDLLTLLKGKPHPADAYHRALSVFRQLKPAAVVSLAGELRTTARWSYRSAAAGLRRTVPRATLRRGLAPRRLTEDVSFADLMNGTTDLFALLFPPPSQSLIDSIVYATGWADRLLAGTRLAEPAVLAQAVASGLAAGHNPRQIASALSPLVGGVESSARRIARTESLRVAQAMQERCHRQLGGLVVGWQVHATLDQNTRPEHAARNGTVYHLHPKAGQPGMDKCPHPPNEADGSVAWNCRCFLTPVLSDPGVEVGHAAPPTPDVLVYSDWWATADERRKRLAVGTRRYSQVRELLGGDPEWVHFLDPKTGQLLAADKLKAETAAERRERVRAGRAALAGRRKARADVLALGHERR